MNLESWENSVSSSASPNGNFFSLIPPWVTRIKIRPAEVGSVPRVADPHIAILFKTLPCTTSLANEPSRITSEDGDVICKSLSLVSLGKYQPLFKHGQSIIRDLGMCDLKSFIYQTNQPNNRIDFCKIYGFSNGILQSLYLQDLLFWYWIHKMVR